MSEEPNTRSIKGTIEFWTKEIREEQNPVDDGKYYEAGFRIDGTWHNIKSTDKEQLEKLKEDAPRGSEVEFDEWRKTGSKVWNYKVGSWNLVKKGEGSSWKGGNRSFGYKPTREEYLKEKASIIVQSMIARAGEQEPLGTPVKDVLKRATELLEFHNDKLGAQASVLEALWKGKETIKEKSEEEAIPMDEIN